MKKILFLTMLCTLLLVGCEASDKSKRDSAEEIQIEMSKKFDVPISNVNVDVAEMDNLTYTNNKFLINIKGEERVYMYIGNNFDDYELLIYEDGVVE